MAYSSNNGKVEEKKIGEINKMIKQIYRIVIIKYKAYVQGL